MTVRFSVADTGIGIPINKTDRLFQSFSQVDASTTRHYGGTGLGLAISQSLVELMGGTIGVDSEAGKGSTFWFEVPFAVVSDSDEDECGQARLAGLRALIVDDNETNRIILAEYAAGWGIDSVTTSSVDKALAAVECAEADGSPFHLVLTDYNMPQRNGLDLSRALKQHPQLVVLLLGSSDDVCLEPAQMREHGIDAILHNPLRRHELYDVLCGVLGSHNALTQSSKNKPPATHQKTPLTGHILIAEDNSINRMYMVELMKQLGRTFNAVTSGREAVDAVRQGKYDLVLMDCQMPEVDGYDAAQQIRQWESDGMRSHLPIIALTANAVKGDRERCLEAGMDEYLSKPVQKEQVANMFARFLGDKEESATAATVATNDEANQVADTAPIDAESLLARCFGNLEFAGSLLDELESTGIERVEEIRRSAAQQNAAATADAAHALKGAAGILCAEAVQTLAAEIEQAGRSSDIDTVESELNDLLAEMQRCLNYLPQLRRELNIVKQKG